MVRVGYQGRALSFIVDVVVGRGDLVAVLFCLGSGGGLLTCDGWGGGEGDRGRR